jgi:5-methylcytosine-specific restriction endonuclease McrA
MFEEITEGPTSIFGYDGKVHPERATAWEWRAWRMRKARERGTHTKEQWIELRDRIGRCVGCDATDLFLTKDHIFPVSRGGCDCIENIQPLCQPCNSRKCAGIE